MIQVKKANSQYLPEKEKLCWWPWHERVMLCCPAGHHALLDDHKIASDGTVTPSVICPSCDFHEHVRLLDFEELER